MKGTLQDELTKCSRCGFCLAACPIYQATGLESKAPRGRNFLARAVLKGELAWSKELRESLFQCLGCRACVEACFPALETDEVVMALRSAYRDQFGRPWPQRYLFRRLLPDPRRLGAAVKRAAWLQPGAGVARVLRLLPWFDRDFLRGLDLLPSLPSRTLRERWPNLEGSREGGRQVAYFGGCAFQFALPKIGSATLRLLQKAGFQVVWPEHGCCGLPAFGHGDPEGARIMARKNLELFRNLKVEAVVTECASCSSFLKKYPSLLAAEPDLARQAEAFRRQVRDINEFLDPLDLPLPRTARERVVTFHDPCHLHRFQMVKDQPRALLRRVPGVKLAEMAEADGCCGGGAGLNLSHYDLSMRVLERKMGNVLKTGAEVLTTSCPGCYLQLRHGVKRSGANLEVRHLTEILAGMEN